MHDLEQAILSVWRQLLPTLTPDALARRLARRQSATLQRPPRPWCLAVRATDARLPPPAASSGARPTAFDISLTRQDLFRLCAPVTVPAPGLPLRQAAELLGTTPNNLLHARVNGLFQTRHVPHLAGRPGKPQPVLSCKHPLDPAARSFQPPDPLWCWTAHHLPSRLPEDFAPQRLTLVPHYQSRTSPIDPTALHPEHPLNDPHPKRNTKSLALPKPAPDYVAYKWQDDRYVGYDHTHDATNPLPQLHHLQHQLRTLRQNRRRREHRRLRPSPGAYTASLDYRGLRWLCPRCGRKVNLLFLPLSPFHLFIPEHTLRDDRAFRLHFAAYSPTFACERCHRIKRLSRCDPNAWNELVSYLSGGLLYGKEVPRPDTYPKPPRPSSTTRDPKSESPDRKIPYTPRPTRAPSQRRPQVERLLLTNHTFKEIAAQLHIEYGTVLWHAQQVYKQHHVRSLNQLLQKHGQAPKVPKKERIRRLLATGRSIAEIATELDLPASAVYQHVYMLKKAGKLPRKRVEGGQPTGIGR